MRLHSIGADPELFVTKGKQVSAAIGLLGGSKNNPRMIRGFGIQEDNVLAEFSMPAVTITHGYEQQFSRMVKRGIDTVTASLKQAGLQPCDLSSHEYSVDELRGYGQKALEFGCDPDRNAYTGEWNPAPNNESTLRTAGGHIHVGLPERVTQNDVAIRMVIKAMDLYLGVPSVILDPDNRRRELYGKAGAYRNKPYGAEYRTLSNFWIQTDVLRKWAAERAYFAVMSAHNIEMLLARVGEEAVQDCINTGNVDLARHILQVCNIKDPLVGAKDASAA